MFSEVSMTRQLVIRVDSSLLASTKAQGMGGCGWMGMVCFSALSVRTLPLESTSYKARDRCGSARPLRERSANVLAHHERPSEYINYSYYLR